MSTSTALHGISTSLHSTGTDNRDVERSVVGGGGGGSEANTTRPRRDADNNATTSAQDKEKTKVGGQEAKNGTAPPGAAAKKTKVNAMKNRIYTSQISYPSPSGSGGRIFGAGSGGVGSNSTRLTGANSTMERERIRSEFYATYDVMTGIRIAATLGGFFAFVILLVMFKSRSHTNQALKDPKIVAVAAAVVLEEEERELQERLDATGLTLYADDINYEYRRQRLLSLGGFDPALIDSPRRYSYGYASVRPKQSNQNISRPGSRRSSSDVQTISRHSYDYPPPPTTATIRDQYHHHQYQHHQYQQQHAEDDEFIMVEREEQENEFEEIEFRSSAAPPPRANSYDSRRCSSITCCSTESSYLERRCSALTLGIYTIGANVIQTAPPPPTPASPCATAIDDDGGGGFINDQASVFTVPVQNYPGYPITTTTTTASTSATAGRALRSGNCSRRFSGRSSSRRSSSSFRRRQKVEDPTDISLTLAADTDPLTSTTLRGTAPLASLSSFKISSVDQPEQDLRSVDGSDSVFCEPYVDTDEEVAQFSSDSEVFEGAATRNVFMETPVHVEDEDGEEEEKEEENVIGEDRVESSIPLQVVVDTAEDIVAMAPEAKEDENGQEEDVSVSVAVQPESGSSLCHSSAGGGNEGDIKATSGQERESMESER